MFRVLVTKNVIIINNNNNHNNIEILTNVDARTSASIGVETKAPHKGNPFLDEDLQDIFLFLLKIVAQLISSSISPTEEHPLTPVSSPIGDLESR